MKEPNLQDFLSCKEVELSDKGRVEMLVKNLTRGRMKYAFKDDFLVIEVPAKKPVTYKIPVSKLTSEQKASIDAYVERKQR